MNIDYKDNILQINDARIIYRNFSGAPTKFNREGDRNFAVVIPDEETAEELIEQGWNVKIRPPRDPEESPFRFLPVKIKFNGRGPSVYLQSGERMTRLSEDTISMVDEIDIKSVSLDVRPYDWEVNGKTGRAAYLQAMKIEQNLDRFGADYAQQASELPF